MIDEVLDREREKALKLKLSFDKRLAELPKGTLTIREVKGNKYCYFRYREGQKIRTVYAGPARNQDEYERQIAEREKIIEQIKELDYEIKRIDTMKTIR